MSRRERQPAALSFLLFVLGCERFAHYGLRVGLTTFFLKKLGLEHKDLSAAFALFSTTLYLGPLVGSLVADRFLGRHKAVLAGGILMAIGVLALAANAPAAFALGTFVAGCALFRPTVPALIGDLYRQGDPRRDAGFTWMNLVVNVAALLGSVALVAKGFDSYDTTTLFVIAAGVLVATTSFAVGHRVLRAEGFPGSAAEAPSARFSQRDLGHIAIAVLGGMALSALVVFAWPTRELPSVGVPMAGAALLLVIAFAANAMREKSARTPPLGAVAWRRLGVLGALGLFSMVVYVVIGFVGAAPYRLSSRDMLAESDIPAWLRYGMSTLVASAAAIPLALWWRRLDASPNRPSGITKMAGGMMLSAAAVGLVSLVGQGSSEAPLIAAMLVSGLGEVVFFPIGMAMVSKLAPSRYAAFAMAVWSAFSLLGNALLGPLLDASIGPVVIAVLAVGAGALLFVLTPALRRAMAGAEDAPAVVEGTTPYRAPGEVSEPGEEPAMTEPADEDKSTRQMMMGALWALGGIFVTVASMTSGSGRVVIAWGAIAYGIITFVRGASGPRRPT